MEPRLRAALHLFCLLGAVACRSTPSPAAGAGLLAVDRTPPPGAVVFPTPVWTPGDRFVYRRGGRLRAAYVVEEADSERRVLRERRTGMAVVLDGGLRELGRGIGRPPKLLRRFRPFDARLAFPLWVGKRWTVDFFDVTGGEARHLRVHYRCEARERLATAAGTFDCLRILRRAELLDQGTEFFERSALSWYAPEVGWFARRLEDGMLVELEDWQRQRKEESVQSSGRSRSDRP